MANQIPLRFASPRFPLSSQGPCGLYSVWLSSEEPRHRAGSACIRAALPDTRRCRFDSWLAVPIDGEPAVSGSHCFLCFWVTPWLWNRVSSSTAFIVPAFGGASLHHLVPGARPEIDFGKRYKHRREDILRRIMPAMACWCAKKANVTQTFSTFCISRTRSTLPDPKIRRRLCFLLLLLRRVTSDRIGFFDQPFAKKTHEPLNLHPIGPETNRPALLPTCRFWRPH